MTSSFAFMSRASHSFWLAAWALLASVLLGACARSPAPDSTFVLLDGSTIQTSSLKGRVTLVNFWATSCVSCVAEMPDLIKTYQKYRGKGYETVAVAMSYDPPAFVVNFAQTRQLPFKVAIDNTGAVARAWGDVQLTPTSFVVNRKGEIVKQFVGPPDFSELNALIERLLSET